MSEISLRRSPRLRKRDVRLGLKLKREESRAFPIKREKVVVRRCYTLSGAVDPPLGYLRHFAAVTELA